MPTILSNTLLFFVGKISHIFPMKNNSIFVILTLFKKFNETLTNDVVKFEQPAPGQDHFWAQTFIYEPIFIFCGTFYDFKNAKG